MSTPPDEMRTRSVSNGRPSATTMVDAFDCSLVKPSLVAVATMMYARSSSASGSSNVPLIVAVVLATHVPAIAAAEAPCPTAAGVSVRS